MCSNYCIVTTNMKSFAWVEPRRLRPKVAAYLMLAGVPGTVMGFADAGPSINQPDTGRMFAETFIPPDECSASLRLKFTCEDATISGATGGVRDGRSLVYAQPTATATSVSNVSITRYMFLMDATVPGGSSATLASQVHIPGWYTTNIASSPWYSTVMSVSAAAFSPSLLSTTELSPDSLSYGYNGAYFKDFVFILESVTSFEWTEHLANFSGLPSQPYWAPATGINSSWMTNGTATATSTSTTNHTGAYYSMEKRTMRVYYRKDQLTDSFSIDTRLTFSQPDSVGATPYPDPNEPAQHVDFSSFLYKGGMFLGKSKSDTNPRDRSGLSIIEGSATYNALSSGEARIYRGVTLFCSDRATHSGYSTSSVNMGLAIPDSGVRSLADMLTDPKRWKYRWPVTMSGDEPIASDTVGVNAKEALYSWTLPGSATTSTKELFAIYPVGYLSGAQAASTWHYFVNHPYLASSDIPSDLKSEAKRARSWDIKRGPVTVDSTIYERVRWDPSWSGLAP